MGSRVQACTEMIIALVLDYHARAGAHHGGRVLVEYAPAGGGDLGYVCRLIHLWKEHQLFRRVGIQRISSSANSCRNPARMLASSSSHMVRPATAKGMPVPDSHLSDSMAGFQNGAALQSVNIRSVVIQ